MSFLTHLLETTPHFENSIVQLEKKLNTIKTQSRRRLKTLVQLAYCYAHVQLQKGVAAADEAIILAETLSDQSMKANALCAKAMNEFRIGYVAKSQATARQALSIFNNTNDEEGQCDACFQLGLIPYVSQGPGNPANYLEIALKKHESLKNKTGVYLVRIQQIHQYFLKTQFEEGVKMATSLIKELSLPQQQHLLCFAHMQLSIGMYIKQDVTAFMNCMIEWQKIALANGNYHDYTMTKAMLPDCYRLQHLDRDVMNACLESVECSEKLGSIHGHITVFIVMAHICADQEHYQDSLIYYKKAIKAALEIEDSYKYLMALNAMGAVYLKLGQTDEAFKTFQKAQHESRLANDRLNIIGSQRHLAELAYQQGKFDSALFDFKILFDSANNSDEWNMQDNGNYASSIARASDAAFRKAGLNPEERNIMQYYYLKRYLLLAQEKKNLREEVNALKSMVAYFEEMGDLSEVVQYSKKYIQLYERLVNEESFKDITKLRLQYETEKNEHEITLLKKEREQSLLNERLRISRELHDEVGATLSGIAMYSHLIKDQIMNGNEAGVKASLSIMQRSLGEMVNKLNEIVWLINPEQDSLLKLTERLEEYAREMAVLKNMQVKITLPVRIAELSLPVQNRRNIYLFCKEAIINAVKYSNGSLLELSIKEIDGKLEFSISDNGKGFDAGIVRKGNGLENMHKRAEELGTIMVFQSNKNDGTSVSLQCRIT